MQALKFRNESVNSSPTSLMMWLLTHAGIRVNPFWYKGLLLIKSCRWGHRRPAIPQFISPTGLRCQFCHISKQSLISMSEQDSKTNWRNTCSLFCKLNYAEMALYIANTENAVVNRLNANTLRTRKWPPFYVRHFQIWLNENHEFRYRFNWCLFLRVLLTMFQQMFR